MSRAANPAPCATRHVVILAAGESKRTRPLTSHRPKPLIALLGQPLLAHILDELVGLVDRATLVVGYRAEAIIAAFGEQYRGIALRYVLQKQVNGTAGALRAVGQIDEPFFLLYGDNLVARADVLGVCAARYSMAGLHVDDARAFGVLQIVDGLVRGVIEKPADPPPGALANPGIFHLDGAAFPALARIEPSPRGEYELTDLVELLAADHPFGYHTCTGFWVPVGSPWEALSAAQFLLARRAGLRAQIDPAAAIAADARISGAVTIGRARLEPGCQIIGPAHIGDGCVVGAGALIEAASVGPQASVGVQAVVRNSVLGARTQVGQASLIESSWIDDGASVGYRASLRAGHFAELRPAAHTAGLLSPAALRTRGTIVGQGVALPAGAILEPGGVVLG